MTTPRWRPPFLKYIKPKFQRGKSLSSGSFEGWHFWWGPIHMCRVKTHDNPNIQFKICWQPRGPATYAKKSY